VFRRIGVRRSAKADYAVRAAVELADAPDEKPVKAERVTIADVARGQLPTRIDELAEDPEAWVTR
jgi:hypothetical protein